MEINTIRASHSSPQHPMATRVSSEVSWRPVPIECDEGAEVYSGQLMHLSKVNSIIKKGEGYKNRFCFANDYGMTVWTNQEAWRTKDYRSQRAVFFYSDFIEFLPRVQAEDPNDTATYHSQAVRHHQGTNWNYFGFRAKEGKLIVFSVPSESDYFAWKEFLIRQVASKQAYHSAYPGVVSDKATQTTTMESLSPNLNFLTEDAVQTSNNPLEATVPKSTFQLTEKQGNVIRSSAVRVLESPIEPEPPSPKVILHEAVETTQKESHQKEPVAAIDKLQELEKKVREKEAELDSLKNCSPVVRWVGGDTSSATSPVVMPNISQTVVSEQMEELKRLREEIEEYRKPEYAHAAAEVVRLSVKNREAEEIITELKSRMSGSGGDGDGILKLRMLKQHDASKSKERMLTQQLDMAHRSRDALLNSLQHELASIRDSVAKDQNMTRVTDDTSEAGDYPRHKGGAELITNTMSHLLNLKLFSKPGPGSHQFHTNLWTDAEHLSQISSFDDPLPLLSDDGTNRKLFPTVNRTWRFQDPSPQGHQVIVSLLVVPPLDHPAQIRDNNPSPSWALRYRSPSRKPTRRRRAASRSY